MKNNLLNKINNAISNGIELGFDIYDADQIEDLTVEMQYDTNHLKRFQDIVLKSLFHEMNILLNDVDPNTFKVDFDINCDFPALKILCTSINSNTYTNIFEVKDKDLLKYLIYILTEIFGNFINLNWINVKNVTDMSGMFEYTAFNGDISRWDVSNVKDMSLMFRISKFNGDLSRWNVSNVENMQHMFASSQFNRDISTWDVSNIKNMSYMFYDCPISENYKPNLNKF